MNSSESEKKPSVEPPIDIRFGIPLFARRFYITINAGRERRSNERRKAERTAHPLLKPGNLLFFITALTMLYIVGLVGILIYSSVLDF